MLMLTCAKRGGDCQEPPARRPCARRQDRAGHLRAAAFDATLVDLLNAFDPGFTGVAGGVTRAFPKWSTAAKAAVWECGLAPTPGGLPSREHMPGKVTFFLKRTWC
jgi:hypothetical protein